MYDYGRTDVSNNLQLFSKLEKLLKIRRLMKLQCWNVNIFRKMNSTVWLSSIFKLFTKKLRHELSVELVPVSLNKNQNYDVSTISGDIAVGEPSQDTLQTDRLALLRIVFCIQWFYIIQLKFNTIHYSDPLLTYCIVERHPLTLFF